MGTIDFVKQSFSVTTEDEGYICVRTTREGLSRLEELCKYANIQAMFINHKDTYYLMYIWHEEFIHLVQFSIELRDNIFLLEQYSPFIDTSIFQLFYDLVFNDKPCSFDKYKIFKRIKMKNLHLQELCRIDIIDMGDTTFFNLKNEYNIEPELKLYGLMFNVHMIHSKDFFKVFCDIQHGYLQCFEGEKCVWDSSKRFYPESILKQKYFVNSQSYYKDLICEFYKFLKAELQFEEQISKRHYAIELQNGFSVYETNCTCNLMFIFEFCKWVFEVHGFHEYRYIFNVDIVMDMIRILRQFSDVSTIAEWLNRNAEEIDFYEKEAENRENVRKDYDLIGEKEL
jgi:hypothetical protein